MTPAPVLVIGEALIDIVVRGDERTEVVGGSPANVALGLARLGRPVRFLTALARDPRGERIADHLRASGVDVDDDSWLLARTSTAQAVIGPTGAATYDFEIDARLASPRLGDAAHVHIGSISAFLAPGADVVEHFLRSLPDEITVSFDPNIRPALVGEHPDALARFERLAARADILKLSDEDAEWLYPQRTVDALLRGLRAGRTRLVALTAGGDGAHLASGGGAVALAAPDVAVRDTIGAGDTFMAALVDAVLTGPAAFEDPLALDTVGRTAIAAAAITVQRHGADLPTRADLDRASR